MADPQYTPQAHEQPTRSISQGDGVPVAGDEGRVFDIRHWGGIDTKADRTAIDDQDFSWIENYMPIGSGNLRAMFDRATALLTAGGKTIVYFEPFNIGSTQYIAVFYSDGTADQVDMSAVVTHISTTPNTFYTGGSLPNVAQWGASGILIVTTASANGYFAWDGSTLYPAGNNVSPGWLGGNPVVSIVGNSHTSTTIDSITSTAALSVGQFINGPGVPLNTFITVIAAHSITLSQATTSSLTGATFSVQANAAPTGNTHTNTTVDNLTTTSGVIPGMLVFDAAGDIPSGTTVASVTSTTAIVLSQAATGTNTGTQFAFGWGMPTGMSGTAVEVFQSRVIIDNGATKSISAPANGANFSGGQGGTIITSTDSFLRRAFIVSKQSNGFLYSFGDSSINVISNIQSGGSPVVVSLNNQNVDPQVGTTWPGTVHAFGRGLMFANPTGVYALYGGAAEKVSDKLDGLFASADFVTTVPTGAVATLFGVRVYMITLRTVDYVGVVRVVVCIWDGKKWFLASQTLATNYIETQEIDSVLNAWGTDGTSLFKMFQQPSTAITKVLQTKLWSGDSYLVTKQALRNYSLGTDFSGNGYTLTGTLDLITETTIVGTPKTLTSPTLQVFWINNTGGAVQFRNALLQNVNFVGNTVLGLLGTNVNGTGALLGETLTSTSSNFTLAALTLLYRRQSPVGG